MNFKRYNGRTWETVQHKVYGSGTEQLASFPAVIQASGEPLTDYLISGNTVQDGTPTPEAPVDVVGCGVRTGNVLNNLNIVQGGWLAAAGTVPTLNPSTTRCRYSYFFPVLSKTVLYDFKDLNVNIVMMDSDGLSLGGSGFLTGSGSFTLLSNAVKISLIIANSDLTADITETYARSKNISLDYGYKLHLTVNGTEYPIYLGEAQTTRRIKKLVLTGEEAFFKNYPGNPNNYLYYQNGYSVNAYCFCTHLVNMGTLSPSKVGVFNSNSVLYLNFGASIMSAQPSGNTVSGLKEYLAAQYGAGTPVTIWYVLAAPKTSIVNEPLHKIGNYADTITMAQADVTIPTSDGDNTISFDTTVQPSAMSATFKGWHPVQAAKQYDGNDWS